jgi:ParB family transcriptional regulator, chromosome partitioning protein
VADSIRNIDPEKIRPNPENPRLIFHADELAALQESIGLQGILVPLTVYAEGDGSLVLLDGERRWRCAMKLGLPRVPVIVQPKPDRLQNIMMMFAIHNARRDWDPLPTAYKLEQLEGEFLSRQGRPPNESELAELASLTRGEVRRLKNLLALPQHYRDELMRELELPRSEQVLTVDVVLEATRGAAALVKRDVIDADEEDDLRRAILDKYRARVMRNTIEPRQLARIARAVDRGEVSASSVRKVVRRLIDDPEFPVSAAYERSVAQADFEHGTEQIAERLLTRLAEHGVRGYETGEGLRAALQRVVAEIRRILG